MKTSKQTVHLVDSMGSDLAVVNAARVSFHKESLELVEKDVKLISYLAKHNHFTPFAHNSLTFRIKAPIFVARQLVKHQVGGVWNEVSRRYVDDEPEFYFPEVWHGKPTTSKQGASEQEILLDENFYIENPDGYTMSDHEDLVTLMLNWYTNAIKQGLAPEEARMFLPLNCMTEWWWTGSLMFFARVCKQRLDAHAQSATREVAKMISEQIPQEFTHSWKALMQ